MRKGEVQALAWQDIDLSNNEITVNKTLSVKTKGLYKITSTKNYINRQIKISRTLKEQLILYKQEMMKYTDYSEKWFVFGCSRFMPQMTIDRKKQYYFKQAKLELITIHDFRHSHASFLLSKGIPITVISKRLGHSNCSMTLRIYSHIMPDDEDKTIDLLNKLKQNK